MVKVLTKQFDGGGDEGLRPVDGVGGDGAIYRMFQGQVALVQSHSLGILFHLSGKEEIIVSTQQDEDFRY